MKSAKAIFTKLKQKQIQLIASGDLRQSANEKCWPAQNHMEEQLQAAFAKEGMTIRRGHPYDPKLKHGFIWNQRVGRAI